MSEENKPKVYAPASYKQKLLLSDTTTTVLIAGGAAGSGKSYCCLVKILPLLSDPAARILVLRQTSIQIKAPGGLLDVSTSMFPDFGGIYKSQAMKWVFPSGSTVQFAAIGDKRDLAGWQGKLIAPLSRNAYSKLF